MKIAVWHNLPSGGGKRSLYHHVKGLIEKGHVVESWCPSIADQTYLPLNELITEHIVPFTWKPRPTKTPINRFLASYYEVIDKIKAIDDHCKECAEEINRSDFDLLFVNPCQVTAVASIARYVKKIPKILYLQEPYRILYEARPNPPWAALPSSDKSQWSLRQMKIFLRDLSTIQGLRVKVKEEWQNAQAFDTILANSCFSRESILRAYGLEAKVCYLGIDTELFNSTDIPREKFVVGLGSIQSTKGIERAVRAIGTIEKHIRPDLIWIGNSCDESYRTMIEKLAMSLDVKIAFKVRISDKEIVELLNRATVMIYTPLLEPFGFAPLEANACGTPVVAIAEGGIRETIQQGINGYLINNNDPVAIGTALTKLLINPDLVRQMGVKSEQYVQENWTWTTAVERLENCFFELYDQKKLVKQDANVISHR